MFTKKILLKDSALKKSPKYSASRIVVVLFMFSCQFICYGQVIAMTDAGDKTTIDVVARRPLLTTVRAISHRAGWIIDYEERSYDKDEVDDIASSTWKASHPSEIGVLVPKQGHLVSTLQTANLNDRTLVNDVVKSGVTGMNAIRPRHPFSSALAKNGRTTVLEGDFSGSKAVFDYDVTTDAGVMDGISALSAIVGRCSKASGHNIDIGSYPIQILARANIRSNGDRVSCRSALTNILDHAKYQLTYSLLFDPETNGFILSVEAATKTLVGFENNKREALVLNPYFTEAK